MPKSIAAHEFIQGTPDEPRQDRNNSQERPDEGILSESSPEGVMDSEIHSEQHPL
jgi:hypothetical protein